MNTIVNKLLKWNAKLLLAELGLEVVSGLHDINAVRAGECADQKGRLELLNRRRRQEETRVHLREKIFTPK